MKFCLLRRLGALVGIALLSGCGAATFDPAVYNRALLQKIASESWIKTVPASSERSPV